MPGALHHDPEAGRVAWQGDRPWRTTDAAWRRVAGAAVHWGRLGPHGHQVASLEDGTPVAVLRRYPTQRRCVLSIEGFEFFGLNRLLGREAWSVPQGFDRASDARAFAQVVLEQAGARWVCLPHHAAEARGGRRGVGRP